MEKSHFSAKINMSELRNISNLIALTYLPYKFSMEKSLEKLWTDIVDVEMKKKTHRSNEYTVTSMSSYRGILWKELQGHCGSEPIFVYCSEDERLKTHLVAPSSDIEIY